MAVTTVAYADADYVRREGLDRLVPFDREKAPPSEDVFAAVGGTATPFGPDLADLARLHRLIRTRRAFTVLECGCGYSTVVIADALRKNEDDWNALSNPPRVRNRFMFQLFSVDASEDWIRLAWERIPELLRPRVHLHHSPVEIGTFNGQLCHYYSKLPDIVADFIYVDGPSPKDVRGDLHGLTFQCDERTVMAGDLLLMESTFLPGTFILLDGRTNNARFLARNFRRTYDVVWDRDADITTFELREERLGRYNVLGSDFF